MTICVDFDGVLNTYTGYEGDEVLFEPAKGVKDFLKELNQIHEHVVIFTARNHEMVWHWLKQHNLHPYIRSVTNTKIPAVLYIDDRGLKFDGDFKKTIEDVKSFKVHWNDEYPFKTWEKEEKRFGTVESRGFLDK